MLRKGRPTSGRHLSSAGSASWRHGHSTFSMHYVRKVWSREGKRAGAVCCAVGPGRGEGMKGAGDVGNRSACVPGISNVARGQEREVGAGRGCPHLGRNSLASVSDEVVHHGNGAVGLPVVEDHPLRVVCYLLLQHQRGRVVSVRGNVDVCSSVVVYRRTLWTVKPDRQTHTGAPPG